MSRFKTTMSATNLTAPQTPAPSLREQAIRPGTPSFMERTVEVMITVLWNSRRSR